MKPLTLHAAGGAFDILAWETQGEGAPVFACPCGGGLILGRFVFDGVAESYLMLHSVPSCEVFQRLHIDEMLEFLRSGRVPAPPRPYVPGWTDAPEPKRKR